MKRILALVLLSLAFCTGEAFAADPRPRPFDVQWKFAVGAGSLFAEEDQTFDRQSVFAVVHWYGLKLPLPGDASSGVGLELGFASPGVPGYRYALWNLNRIDVIPRKVYGGSDLKFGQSDPAGGYQGDYDARIVLGAYLGKVGPGNIIVEFYTLEENRPIAWSLVYRF